MEHDHVSLLDVCSEIVDNRGRTCPVADSGMPLIATNCIRNEALYPTYDNVRYVSPETVRTWFRGHPKPGDILFVNKGTPGRVCMVPDPVDFCIAQDMVALRANPAVVYPPYLFAVLRSHQVQDAVERMHVGTLIPHFKKADFDKLLLPIPKCRKVQEFIGNSYLNLSAKIDLNRKTARVLEGIARAVFTTWFVNFDPVRRAAEGKPTGLPPDLAALFPKRLVDSPIGEVPEGWRVGRWGDIATLEYGKSLRGYEEAAGTHRVYGTNGPIGWHTEALWSSEGIIIGRKGAYRGVHYSAEPFFVIDTAFFLKPIKPLSMKWAFFSLLNHDINAMDSGSAIPSTSREAFYALPVTVPPADLMSRFENLATPLFARARLADQQNATLAALRDALLPKLISGDLRIADVERIVGKAV